MIIVAGMHRSGTSMVARLFHAGGADLGDPETFYRPDRWNPDGYYEQPDIHAVNIPLINGPWGRMAYLRLPSTKTIMRRAVRRSSQIRDAIATYQSCVVKDSRFCLTLPAWLDAGATVNGVVICLRNPQSVARSLLRRNWLPLRHGYRLWIEHNQRLLKHVDGIPLRFLRFDNLMESSGFHNEMKPAFEFVGIESDREQTKSLCEKVVKPRLNHFPQAHDRLPPLVQQMWDELCDRHAAQSNDPSSNRNSVH